MPRRYFSSLVLVTLLVLVVIFLVAIWWWVREETADNSQDQTSLVASEGAMVAPLVNTYGTLEWKQVVAEEDRAVDAETLVFTLAGEAVSQYEAGQEYFVADKAAYENFIPLTMSELTKLQLPNTTIIPRSEYEVWVNPVSFWRVPEDVPGVVSFVVHYQVPEPVPPGTLLNDGFSIWLLPWNNWPEN